MYVSAEDDHWNVLVVECKSLSSDWEKVSAYLGLPFKLIDTVKRDNPRDSAGCWNEALKEWIKQNYNTKLFGRPSWRSLLRAVAEVDKRQFQKLAGEHQGEKLISHHLLCNYDTYFSIAANVICQGGEESISSEVQTSRSESKGLL